MWNSHASWVWCVQSVVYMFTLSMQPLILYIICQIPKLKALMSHVYRSYIWPTLHQPAASWLRHRLGWCSRCIHANKCKLNHAKRGPWMGWPATASLQSLSYTVHNRFILWSNFLHIWRNQNWMSSAWIPLTAGKYFMVMLSTYLETPILNEFCTGSAHSW